MSISTVPLSDRGLTVVPSGIILTGHANKLGISWVQPLVASMTGTRRNFLTGSAAALVGLSLAPTQATALGGASPSLADHVILVDWDGFDPEFLERASHPAIDALMQRGSHGLARVTYSTYSNSCRSSMSTGAYPEVHRNAGYFYDVTADKAVSQNRVLGAETIAEALGRQGRTVASVQWYMLQDHGTSYGDPRHLYVQPGGMFATTVRVAVDILNRRPVSSGGTQVTVPEIPTFMAVYGADLDGLVHEQGTESPAIGPLLESMDRSLAQLVQATIDVGIYDRTAFILTGDHGMSSWANSIQPEMLAAVADTGFRAQVVPPGQSAAADTEVVIVQGVRVASFLLRGSAANPAARARLRAALAGVEHMGSVFDRPALDAMRASDTLGDLVAEAEAPWHFSSLDDDRVRGSHGSTAESQVPLVLAGSGIRSGAPLLASSLVDVAPTVAALLGVRGPADAQGRVLRQALNDDDVG